MAAFQFSVQQVSFTSEDFLTETSSLDSLSSVIDPNVDFVMENADFTEKQDLLKDVAEEWRNTVQYSLSSASIGMKKENMMDKEESIVCSDEQTSKEIVRDKEVLFNYESMNSSYPTIPLPVAHYMNQNNPTLCEEAEKYFNSEILYKNADKVSLNQENRSPSSPLRSMSITSEALALQHSVIGNSRVKPVSADVVAQVVASTKLRLQQGDGSGTSGPVSFDKCLLEHSSKTVECNRKEYPKQSSKSELIRYPSESISSTVEKRSWFSNAPAESISDSLPKVTSKVFSKQKTLNSRSSSQSSINSVGCKKNPGTNDSNVPRVHLSRGLTPKHSRSSAIDVNCDSPYEKSFGSSIDYETESSVSEQYEVESLCSEAFETESNISEVSGIDDEMFQLGKLLSDGLKTPVSEQEAFSENKRVKHNGIQVSAITSNATTSPVKYFPSSQKPRTNDKCTETEEYHPFMLLREKASLEGRLDSITKDHCDILKERDNFSSTAVALEAQLKSVQDQLEVAIFEKKDALKQLDAQTKEHKNWDNVIKEYQNIIETKNSEIKGLKDDMSESEQTNTKARISYEELKVDIESRDGAVVGLKKKIAELHVEVQVLLQGKIQLENEVKNVRLEMDMLQKSKEWYQEQLHITQENRNKLHQELISTQSKEIALSNSIEKATVEINQLKQQLSDTQHRAVTEKEVLMKHLETIEADMMERESLFEEIQKDKGSAESALAERIRKVEDEKSRLTNMTFTISDLDYQLKVLKFDNEEKEKLILNLEKDKAELSKQITILQKSSNEKDLNMQQLNQQIRDIHVKMSHTEMALARSEELITKLRDERTATDVALAAANEEKRVVNESLKVVGENLYKFKSNFKQMKVELLARTSQAEQLLKEKNILEETLMKSEESILILRKEFELRVIAENQSRDVVLNDLVTQKNDVKNVLDVYSKDLLNYRQLVQNLEKQKNALSNELSQLRVSMEYNENKTKKLHEENMTLKEKLSKCIKTDLDFERDTHVPLNNGKEIKMDSLKHDSSRNKVLEDYKKKLRVYKSNIKVLSQKLKEKMEVCQNLNNELKKRDELLENDEQFSKCSSACQCNIDLLEEKKRYNQLENQLKQQQMAYEDQAKYVKKNEEIILELERERGKATGLADSCNNLKLRISELESKLSAKDSHSVQLSCLVDELNNRLAEHDISTKNMLRAAEEDLNKEKILIKSLRQQVFQEKRSSSQLQRQLLSLKSALEQVNQIADSKKQEILSLQSELSLKVQAELKHRAEVEQFQTKICMHQAQVEKVNKELEEVKARDPALAEQLKSLSWHLKEKSNEVSALKGKQKFIEERYKSEIEALRSSLQNDESVLQSIKKELVSTRKEKFSYQAKVAELRKVLKAKLGELESKGILKLENKISSNGTFIEFDIPDPEVSFDESYINSLLQKSMNLPESRPLSNLQACLNSLKQEMVQLQKKIIDQADIVP